MRRLVFATLLTVLGTSLGCGATTGQLQNRAAYDFNCPRSQLQITRIDSRTMGVNGCGQQATYVESCDNPQGAFSTGCTWVRNSR